MNLNPKTGRIIGFLFLAQFILGVLINMFLLGPIIFDEDFLTITSSNTTTVITATLLGIVLSGAGLGIAIILKPFLKAYSNNLALWYLGFTIISFTITIVDNTIILSILSMSKEYVNANIPETEYLQSLGSLLYEMRIWIHMMDMLVGGLSLTVLYYGLYQTKLIPRVLSVLGCIAVIIMLGNVLWSIYDTGLMILYLPVGLVQIGVSIWLIIKGFNLTHLAPYKQ